MSLRSRYLENSFHRLCRDYVLPFGSYLWWRRKILDQYMFVDHVSGLCYAYLMILPIAQKFWNDLLKQGQSESMLLVSQLLSTTLRTSSSAKLYQIVDKTHSPRVSLSLTRDWQMRVMHLQFYKQLKWATYMISFSLQLVLYHWLKRIVTKTANYLLMIKRNLY